MVVILFRGMHRLGHQYLAISVREVRCTRLGYGTRLSKLHTLDPPLAIAVLRGIQQHRIPIKRITTGPPYRVQVPQADLPATGLHNLN
jgi:hypothetical protein